MKTVRRPPYPKCNPGYFPCSSLTPLPLSSRRPSVSFGGFGLKDRVKSAPRKRVYVLIGNEPLESCLDRIMVVLAQGAEPHVQPLMKLNAPEKKPWVQHDWTDGSLRGERVRPT